MDWIVSLCPFFWHAVCGKTGVNARCWPSCFLLCQQRRQVGEKATTNTGAVNPRPSYSQPERDSPVGCRLRTVRTWFTFPMCRPFLPRRVTLVWTRMHDTLTSFSCFSFFRNGRKWTSSTLAAQTLACYEWWSSLDRPQLTCSNATQNTKRNLSVVETNYVNVSQFMFDLRFKCFGSTWLFSQFCLMINWKFRSFFLSVV